VIGRRLGHFRIEEEIGHGGMGIVYRARDLTDAAFGELDQAVESHSEELAFLQVDPLLDPIRKDPRYPALLKRIGFRS